MRTTVSWIAVVAAVLVGVPVSAAPEDDLSVLLLEDRPGCMQPTDTEVEVTNTSATISYKVQIVGTAASPKPCTTPGNKCEVNYNHELTVPAGSVASFGLFMPPGSVCPVPSRCCTPCGSCPPGACTPGSCSYPQVCADLGCDNGQGCSVAGYCSDGEPCWSNADCTAPDTCNRRSASCDNCWADCLAPDTGFCSTFTKMTVTPTWKKRAPETGSSFRDPAAPLLTRAVPRAQLLRRRRLPVSRRLLETGPPQTTASKSRAAAWLLLTSLEVETRPAEN